MSGATLAASYRVTLIHDDQRVEFAAEAGRSIARAAARAGYDLTTGCLQGRCAICRARVVSGAVRPLRPPSQYAVGDAAHRADGCVLLCAVGALADVVLEPLSPWTVKRA